MPNLCQPANFSVKKELSMPKSDESNRIERVFLTFREAQDFLGVSHQTLYKLMGEGLPSHKIGKKRVFFREDLITWIKEH